LGLLVVSFALMGLRLGWIAATIMETDVINKYAKRYVKAKGGDASLTDCAAYSGAAYPGIWIIVSCKPKGQHDTGYEYYVNRLGGFEYGDKPIHTQRVGPQT
jgi:hypothetical protein